MKRQSLLIIVILALLISNFAISTRQVAAQGTINYPAALYRIILEAQTTNVMYDRSRGMNSTSDADVFYVYEPGYEGADYHYYPMNDPETGVVQSALNLYECAKPDRKSIAGCQMIVQATNDFTITAIGNGYLVWSPKHGTWSIGQVLNEEIFAVYKSTSELDCAALSPLTNLPTRTADITDLADLAVQGQSGDMWISWNNYGYALGWDWYKQDQYAKYQLVDYRLGTILYLQNWLARSYHCGKIQLSQFAPDTQPMFTVQTNGQFSQIPVDLYDEHKPNWVSEKRIELYATPNCQPTKSGEITWQEKPTLRDGEQMKEGDISLPTGTYTLAGSVFNLSTVTGGYEDMQWHDPNLSVFVITAKRGTIHYTGYVSALMKGIQADVEYEEAMRQSCNLTDLTEIAVGKNTDTFAFTFTLMEEF